MLQACFAHTLNEIRFSLCFSVLFHSTFSSQSETPSYALPFAHIADRQNSKRNTRRTAAL